MFLNAKYEVNLKRQYSRIFVLFPAYQNTFVFLAQKGSRKQCLVHCDKDGKILLEHEFDCLIDMSAFNMMNQHEVILLQTRNNRLTMVHLQTQQFRYIPFYFLRQDCSDFVELLPFPETKMICILEFGHYNDNRLKLTYFAYPLEEEDLPLSIYQSQDNEWTYQYMIRKVNNHSMVVWFRPRCDEVIQLRCFDLRNLKANQLKKANSTQKINQNNKKAKYKGNFQVFQVRNNNVGLFILQKIQMAINNLWQIKQKVFCLVCTSNKSELCVEVSGNNNNLIFDVIQSSLRQARFYFDPYYNNFLIDQFYLGNFSMFRTYDFDMRGIPKPSPIYYIENASETIISKQEWECNELSKYSFPGYNGSLLIESIYSNEDVSEFVVYRKFMAAKKQLCLHFLIHIDPDLDEGLLADAIEMIDEE